MVTPRTIKVFIASPGDLAVERRAFKDKIDELNTGFGRGADVQFVPLGWEDALSQVGRRSQSVINQDVDACDVFILVMWRRWGQPAPDAAPYSSYTEEEFYRSLARYEKSGSPTIYVFFKHIDPGQMADPGEQLKKVLDFRKKLEQSRKVLYRGFTDETAFSLEIDNHLSAFAKAPLVSSGPRDGVPILPDSVQAVIDRHKDEAANALHEIERLRQAADKAAKEAENARDEARDATSRAISAELAAEAKFSARSLDLAELAAKAAIDGRFEEARQSFAKALDGTTNLRVLYLGYEFYQRIGDLDEAERLLMRWLAVSGRNKPTADTAAALGNFGVIAQTRGDLDAAEKLYKESLEINRKLGSLEGQANQLGNLGVIAQTRGDLDAAEKLHKESLEINRKLGRLEGQANQLGNLGVIAKQRKDFTEARRLWTQSRDLYFKIGVPQMVKKLQDWLDGLPPG